MGRCTLSYTARSAAGSAVRSGPTHATGRAAAGRSHRRHHGRSLPVPSVRSCALSSPPAGAGAWFDVAPGATLTLTKRPRKWSTSEGMFTGAGRVAFAGEADEIHPDW